MTGFQKGRVGCLISWLVRWMVSWLVGFEGTLLVGGFKREWRGGFYKSTRCCSCCCCFFWGGGVRSFSGARDAGNDKYGMRGSFP